MSSNPEARPARTPRPARRPARRAATGAEIKRAAAGLAAIACAYFIFTTVNDPVARIMSFGFLILGLAAVTDAAKAAWSALHLKTRT